MRRLSLCGSGVGIVRVLASAMQRLRAWLTKPRWLPVDLAGCRLVYSEKTFSIKRPIKLTVRVDRAYHDGIAMILMELKTRYPEQVYTSDIIELSAQRLAVRYCTGGRVHDFGYIVLQHPKTRRRTARKVSLLSLEDVIDIAERRKLLIGGELLPRQATKPGCCVQCEYHRECRAEAHSDLSE